MNHFSYLLFAGLIAACSTGKKPVLSRSYVQPASGYSQAVITTYNGLKTIHISGQVGDGEDLGAQMRGALENIEGLLQENGASFKDIVKMNHYIVDYTPEDLEVFRNTRKEIMGDDDMPASTLVGVTSLFSADYRIEIDAIAIVAD